MWILPALQPFFILWPGCCGRALSGTSSGNHHKYDSITLVKPEDLGDVQRKERHFNRICILGARPFLAFLSLTYT